MHSDSGQYTVIRPAFYRQLAMDTFAALSAGLPMVALLELDVTRALEALEAQRREGIRVSLFAFLVRSIAVALAEHPDLNLVRHGKRYVRFADVDLCVPVEVSSAAGKFPRDVVIRRAQDRTPAQIFAEIEAARARNAKTGAMSAEDRWAQRAVETLLWVPRFVRVRLMRVLLRNAFRVKKHRGTALVTSVGKFASIPGFAFVLGGGPQALAVAVGSVVQKPWAYNGELSLRSVIALSLQFDHDLVDGSPAARFARRLQELVESADGLDTRERQASPREEEAPT